MKVVKFGIKSLAAQQKKLEDQLLSQLEGVLITLFPNGSATTSEFVIGDVLGKSGKSLNVCLVGDKRGVWHDFATGESGAILSLIAAHYDLDIKQDMLKVLDRAKVLLAKVSTVTKATLPQTKKANDQLTKVAEWDYLNTDGSYIWTIVRFADGSGGKEIRPFNKQTNEWKAHPPPRPLYNLPGISQAQQVILVEGEKCAQALIEVGICATTSMGGAHAPANKTDWLSLAGKDVLIWPDNDAPGKKYAVSCAEAMLAAGALSCAVLIIPEGMPPKWDAAVALAPSSDFDVVKFVATGECLPFEKANVADIGLAFAHGDWRTEHGIAQVFTIVYSETWKYCATWGMWLRWNGHRWIQDQVLAVQYLAREVSHAASQLADKEGTRAKLASAATASNIERLARADPGHRTSADQWDADPLLLNCIDGVVDLRDGTLLAPDPSSLLTKSAKATPSGDCPLWLEFLKVVTGGDQQLILYLQRVIGYCLTGLTTEHALFFLYGTGANGKSVFLNVISDILGDYAKMAPMDTFMESRSDRHPTDLAGLRGARFVCAIETEQGRRWSESKIKAITGGDIISARFMRQDFFEFKPQFKLLIAGNHKPSISNVDEAMSRRIHLVPFTVFIPPEKRDKNLTEKLLEERDGILAWAIQGLLQWQELGGLYPPEIVTTATKEYLEAKDSIGRWLEDMCELDINAFTSSLALYSSWKVWADEYGEYVGKQRGLSDQLTAKGFKAMREKKVRGFRGLRLKTTNVFSMNFAPEKADPEVEAKL